VYYWLLPPQFLGDKVTSYGGHLNYTVRYVPTPGGQSSRNNAPDVELISVSSFTYQNIALPNTETVWIMLVFLAAIYLYLQL
jgi:hypothetical protein